MIPRRALPLLAALSAPMLARAAFPERTVTLIVPYAPGGSADVLARILAPELARELGQSVAVEQRTGAGGHVGGAHVATVARADGYTILLGSIAKAIGPSLQSLTYDPVGGLTPLGGIGATPMLLTVSPQSPYRGVQELLAAARARPGEITYGSSGPGTGSHLAGEMLAAATDTQMVHVPYRGSGAVHADLVAQRIDFLLNSMGAAAGQVRSGSVRTLGVSALTRVEIFPDVPTIAEQGVAGYEFSLWLGFFVRAGTPEDVFARLEAAHRAAMAVPAVQDRLRDVDILPIPIDAAGFGAYFRADVDRWAALVRAGKVRRLDP